MTKDGEFTAVTFGCLGRACLLAANSDFYVRNTAVASFCSLWLAGYVGSCLGLGLGDPGRWPLPIGSQPQCRQKSSDSRLGAPPAGIMVRSKCPIFGMPTCRTLSRTSTF